MTRKYVSNVIKKWFGRYNLNKSGQQRIKQNKKKIISQKSIYYAELTIKNH